MIERELDLTNRGVSIFVNIHTDQRKKSNFYKILNEVVAGFQPGGIKIAHKLNGILPLMANRLSICNKFIRKLSEVVWFVEHIAVEFAEEEREFILQRNLQLLASDFHAHFIKAVLPKSRHVDGANNFIRFSEKKNRGWPVIGQRLFAVEPLLTSLFSMLA